MPELGLASNDVIECFGLPKTPGAPEDLVDSSSTRTFPPLNQGAERLFFQRLDQRMEMIRHDDPAIELIEIPVACCEQFNENGGGIPPCENARSMSGIQQLMESCGEFPVKSMTLVFRQFIKIGFGINTPL